MVGACGGYRANRVELLPREWEQFLTAIPSLLKLGRDKLDKIESDSSISVDFVGPIESDLPASTTTRTWLHPFMVTSGHAYKILTFRTENKIPFVLLAIRRCNGGVAKAFYCDQVKPILRGVNLTLEELQNVESAKENIAWHECGPLE